MTFLDPFVCINLACSMWQVRQVEWANHAIVGQLIRIHFHLIAAMISHATALDAHYMFGFYLIFIFIMLFSCLGYVHAAPQIASSLVALAALFALVRRVKKYENKTNLNMHNMASAILTTSPSSLAALCSLHCP